MQILKHFVHHDLIANKTTNCLFWNKNRLQQVNSDVTLSPGRMLQVERYMFDKVECSFCIVAVSGSHYTVKTKIHFLSWLRKGEDNFFTPFWKRFVTCSDVGESLSQISLSSVVDCVSSLIHVSEQITAMKRISCNIMLRFQRFVLELFVYDSPCCKQYMLSSLFLSPVKIVPERMYTVGR